jgi:hypothetical protein
MSEKLLKDSLGWGFLLWFAFYVLGFILFFLLPLPLIGWVILPIGTIVTLWVLFKKVRGSTLGYYVAVAVAWTAIAVVFDYFFIVKALNPTGGYYDLGVYLYYALTFIAPLAVGYWKTKRAVPSPSG